MGAGSGGGFPRGALAAAIPASGRCDGVGPLATDAAVADFLTATAGSLWALPAGLAGRAGLLPTRGLAWAPLTAPPRWAPLDPALRARMAPGRFALARVFTPGFLVLEALMTRAPQTLLSVGPGCQLSTPLPRG